VLANPVHTWCSASKEGLTQEHGRYARGEGREHGTCKHGLAFAFVECIDKLLWRAVQEEIVL
jgi:hypothetical protein